MRASVIDRILANTLPNEADNTLNYFDTCSKQAYQQVSELIGVTRVGALSSDETGTRFQNKSEHFEADPYFGWYQKELLDNVLVRMEYGLEILLESLQRTLLGRGALARALEKKDKHEHYLLAKTRLYAARSRLSQILEDRGLTEPFSAVLDTYIIPFAVTGSNRVPTALLGANSKNQTLASGTLAFESERFRDRRIRFADLSVGGRIGIAPTQTIVSIKNGSVDENKPHTLLQNAFHWSFNCRGNIALSRKSEVAPFFAFGQTVLLEDSIAVGPDEGATAALFANNKATHARFWEKGIEVRIYSMRRSRVRVEKKYLSPKFQLATGHRIDERFAGLNEFGFSRPRQRWFVRGFVFLTDVGERNFSGVNKSNPFNLAVGIEYDAAWGTGRLPDQLRVPGNSRVYINASLDLIEAFSKQKK
jgi:hypothetical protein